MDELTFGGMTVTDKGEYTKQESFSTQCIKKDGLAKRKKNYTEAEDG